MAHYYSRGFFMVDSFNSLSHFHFHLIFISLSSSCSFHGPGLSYKPRLAGCYVWNVWREVKLPSFLYCFFWISNVAAGGHSISLGLSPTKLPVKLDFQFGQLDVPAIRFLVHWCGMGLSQEPHTPTLRQFVSLFTILFGTPFEHFSPTFRTQGLDDSWKPLVKASELRTSLWLITIPRISSWWTPLTLYCIWFCMHGIQFLTDPIKDPCLPCLVRCVSRLCVSKLCVGELCVGELCECVWVSCVLGDGRRRSREADQECTTKNKNHTPRCGEKPQQVTTLMAFVSKFKLQVSFQALTKQRLHIERLVPSLLSSSRCRREMHAAPTQPQPTMEQMSTSWRHEHLRGPVWETQYVSVLLRCLLMACLCFVRGKTWPIQSQSGLLA